MLQNFPSCLHMSLWTYCTKNWLTYSRYKAGCVWFTTHLYLSSHNSNHILISQSLFSLNSLSIVFGIRTWFSFQFKKTALTQNCRLKRYSKEENKDSGTKKEQIQYFQVGHISNFRFPPNLIISPYI